MEAQARKVANCLSFHVLLVLDLTVAVLLRYRRSKRAGFPMHAHIACHTFHNCRLNCAVLDIKAKFSLWKVVVCSSIWTRVLCACVTTTTQQNLMRFHQPNQPSTTLCHLVPNHWMEGLQESVRNAAPPRLPNGEQTIGKLPPHPHSCPLVVTLIYSSPYFTP